MAPALARWLAAAATALIALAMTGCGGEEPGSEFVDTAPSGADAEPAAPPRPALCGRVAVRLTGSVQATAAKELSGLVLSRSQPGVMWAVNDSGDSARLLAFSTSGRPLAEVAVTGAENVDWEGLATGGGALLIGDIGDNDARRSSISVYRVREPRARPAPAAAPAGRIELRYPGGPRDAEALLSDPSSGALVIVTKSPNGRSEIYVADHPAVGTSRTLRRAGALSLGVGELVTAADVSADGRTVVVRTYGHAYAWTRRPGESLAATLRRRRCAVREDLLVEGQGETLALARNGRSFFTVPEGVRPAIRAYSTAG